MTSGGTVYEEYTPGLRKDTYYGIAVTGAQSWLALKYKSQNFVLEFSDNIRAVFNVGTALHQVQSVSIRFKAGDDFSTRITVLSQEITYMAGITSYEINWSAIGKTTIKDAKQFINGLKLATTIAEILTDNLTKKSWQ